MAFKVPFLSIRLQITYTFNRNNYLIFFSFSSELTHSTHLFPGWSPHKLRVDSDNAHFTLNGTRVFLSGINQAWNAYAYDFGNHQYQYRRSVYEQTIQQMQQAGGNSIRELLCLTTDGLLKMIAPD